MTTPSKPDVGDDPEMLDLQSSFNEQQAKIIALREIIRQTEVVNDMKNAKAQEKVKNIAQRLTHFKTKVTTSRLNRATSANTSVNPSNADPNERHQSERTDAASTSFQRGRSESSSMEKCSLLRKQIEQNRQKMAERESCKREIEEKVIEIKQRLETTQQSLEKTTELDRSRSYIAGLDTLEPDGQHVGAYDHYNKQASLNPSIRPLDNTSWLNSTAYSDWQAGEPSPHTQFSQHSSEIHLPDVESTHTKHNAMLECEIKSLQEDVQDKNNIIDEQLRVMSQLVNKLTGFENVWSDITNHDVCVVTELRRLQLELLQRGNKLSLQEAEDHLLQSYGYDPLAKITESVQENQEHLTSEETVAVAGDTDGDALRSALDKIASLEQTIATLHLEMEKNNQQMSDLRHSLEEKTIELNVMTANVSVLQEKLKTYGPKPLFALSADEELETETSKLKQQLDESNKSMIKCKLRIKQLQKQVDTFKKMSNAHEEVTRLTEELHVLSMAKEKVTKTNEPAEDLLIDEPTLAPDTLKRIERLELTCQNQASAMQLLEEQKNDLSEDLCRTRNELQLLTERAAVTESGDNGRIASQMLSIELEEQLEKSLADKTELMKVLHTWEAEKAELLQKLRQCTEENSELLSKIEKLSIEKVSSAESIEILENLTSHEKQEMEKSEKRSLGQEIESDGQMERADSKENLNDSLLKLKEESKELMDKVEMFTDERREVLEKLDAISVENQAYICELDKLKEVNEQLRSYSVELESAKSSLEEKLQAINDEKESILQHLGTAGGSKTAQDESGSSVSSFQTPTSAVPQEASVSIDSVDQALVAVETEVNNYGKNKDKQRKLQVSKKLAANAKNLVTMTKQLLTDYRSCLIEHTLLSDQVALLSQQLQTVPREHAASSSYADREKVARAGTKAATRLEESELDELKPELEFVSEKSSDDEPELLKVELNSKNDEIVALKRIMESQSKMKTAELLHLQQQLLDAQADVRQLQHRAAQAEELRSQCDKLHVERATSEEMIAKLRADLQHSNELVEQQLEAIDAMEIRIAELSQSVEESRSSHSMAEAMRQRVEELTASLNTVSADDVSAEKAELEQKNQELLDKLKKFAANLKRKNVQCNELEQENKQLAEQNERLLKQEEHDKNQLRDENETLAQKLHHLNNELHRLLEQKYQMEAELQTSRDGVASVNEKLHAAQEEQARMADRLLALEEELQAQQVELEAARKELVSKNSKIEKCKAIIKEKIKETHRLQEHARRTTYLEDELRMTQSKLEDFHNQTLLLGRLKSEKEELNSQLKAEQQQRNDVEQLLDEKEQELAAVQATQRRVNTMLESVRSWVLRFADRWRSTKDVPLSDTIATEAAYISDLFDWCAELTATECAFARTLVKKNDDLCAVNQRLQETEQNSRSLHAEIDLAKEQLRSVQQESVEQKQTIDRLTQDLEDAQTELQQTMGAHSRLEQLQMEWHNVQTQLHAAVEERGSLQHSLATAEQHQTELMHEIEQLRETVATCREQVQQEKANAEELLSANRALHEELEVLQKQTLAANSRHQDLQLQYDNCQQEHELKLVQLIDEAQARENKLHDELRQKNSELDAVRDEYDEQLVRDTQSKEDLGDILRRKDQEMDLLRKNYEEQLSEATQTKNELNETLEAKLKELKALRKGYEEQLLQQTQATEQLNSTLQQKHQEWESVRIELEKRLLEETQSKDRLNDAIRAKDGELATIRREYEEQLSGETVFKHQLNATLQEKDDELELLRKDLEQQFTEKTFISNQLGQSNSELESLRERYEAQLAERAQSEAQLNNALRQNSEELQSLRNSMQEQLANKLPTKDQLDELQDEELAALREDYEEQLAEVKRSMEQLHEALERKNIELESLRKTYKECCEQQDVLGRRHFQEMDTLQQKLLESVGERVSLQQSIDSMTRAVDEQATENAQLRARVAVLEKQTSENLTNTSILSTLNEALTEELDQLQERMHATEDGIGEAQGGDAMLQGVIRKKNETIEQLCAQQKLMQQEIVDLKVKAGKLLRKLKETRARCDALEASNAVASVAVEVGDGWEVDTAPQGSSDPLPDERVRVLESQLNDSEAKLAKMQREKDALVVKLETLETACEKLTELKEHQDRQIDMLRDAAQELRDRLQNTNAAPSAPDAQAVELQLADLRQANRLLETEKSEMVHELEMLNQQILHDLQFEDRLQNAMLQLDAKNVELQMLRSTLEQLQATGTAHAVAAVSRKETTTLQAPVPNVEEQKIQYEQQLGATPPAAEDGPVGEQQLTTDGAAGRLIDADIQEVLERQEMEIVSLKEQLALRSAEYARLASHVDPTRLLSLINSGAAVAPVADQQQNKDRDSRAELELALYMIYQRDMRCDELELELRNLLEERDALQLRLSNALRMHEEFRIKCTAASSGAESADFSTSGECSIESSADRPAVAVVPTAADDARPLSGMSKAADSPDLSSKLSELQSISYSKEKRWQEEREDRNRQLTLMQRDLANMPLEAAAKITGTDATMHADASSQQSASSVLLNWILGKK